jgi:Arc/MetJ family transcription regulator
MKDEIIDGYFSMWLPKFYCLDKLSSLKNSMSLKQVNKALYKEPDKDQIDPAVSFFKLINIDIDEVACRRVMKRYNLTTMKDAVNFALNQLAVEPMTLKEAIAMGGTGWDGDIPETQKITK